MVPRKNNDDGQYFRTAREIRKTIVVYSLAASLIASIVIVSGELGSHSKAYAIKEQGQYIRSSVETMALGQQHGISQALENQTAVQQQPLQQNTTIHSFEDNFIEIVNDTRKLSLAYQDEIAKFQSGIYDNQTFVTITDIYLQLYERLLSRAESLQQPTTLPANYSRAIDLYLESIRAEMASHEYFRSYLATGDLEDNERSLDLLSDSLRYEMEAFQAFMSVPNDNTGLTLDRGNNGFSNSTMSTIT